ncbi:MAG: PIN domain-containing protein [Sandaracinaceae bacterium]|nr:PIN domain-containing protein [Sandaracinaceae bacterium]
MKEAVLDAGALIALERGDPMVRAYLRLAEQGLVALTTSSAVVAQVWRGGARQARLARTLNSDLLTEEPLARSTSRRIGLLAAATGATDVVDGHVALIALERDAVVLTSDPEDLVRWGVPGDRLVIC